MTPSSQEEFNSLRELLDTPEWPTSINERLLCDLNSDAEKLERGRSIMDLMVEDDLTGRRFLDYGCGEGHCAWAAAERSADMAVGYDRTGQGWERFEQKPNFVCTTDKDVVSLYGPFDVILLFDVLDHLEGAKPEDVLGDIRSWLTHNGKAYVRTHPFTSRHAIHNYYELNKAYAHLVFTKDEIRQLLPEPKHVQPNVGVTTPIVTYAKWFKSAGLKVLHERPVKEKVEGFFKSKVIAKRIIANTGMPQFPEFQMSIQFIDYVLSPA